MLSYMNNDNLSRIIAYCQYHSLFLSIWLVSLAIVIIISLILWHKSPISENGLNSDSNQQNSISPNPTNNYFFYPLTFCFVFFVSTYIWLILNNAEFAYHDNSQFTFVSLQDKFFDFPIWRESGRYWPLGLQEYNLISLFSKSIIAYHSFSIFQLLVTIFCCVSILPQLKLSYKIILTTFILILPSFVISYFGLIFPERNLIFWLAIFIFCLEKVNKNKSSIYILGVFIATQFLLYYKEPVFLIILCFALSRLIIKALNQQIFSQGKSKILEFIKDNWLDFGLIILVLVFLGSYIFYIQGKVETSYASSREEVNTLFTLISYLRINPILSIFLFVFIIRIYGLIINKYKFNLIWDSLAIGHVLYFLAYVKLNIFTWYYSAPVDFFATLYLANLSFTILSNRKKYKYIFFALMFLTFFIFMINCHYSSYAILSRKQEINAKVQIAKFLDDYRQNNQMKEEQLEIFYPANSGYEIMEFSAFLNYKNFSILIKDQENLNGGYLTMKAPELFTDNLCISYRPFQCFSASKPQTDDLIIFIPRHQMLGSVNLRNDLPIELIDQYKHNSVQLFHYQPKFTGIERILYLFCSNVIDEQWLNGYVFTNFNSN